MPAFFSSRLLLLLLQWTPRSRTSLMNMATTMAHALSTTITPQKSRHPSVAIIGGGVAGLSCAERLGGSSHFDVTVYDTGRLRPGGRCSSRQPMDIPKEAATFSHSKRDILSKVRFDHAAQVIALESTDNNRFSKFRQQLKEWEANGHVLRFPEESVFVLDSENKMTPVPGTMYYGANGMGSIPESIIQQSGGSFHVQQDVWVSPSNGVKYMPTTRQWKVQAGGKVLGIYDSLVIAHNGKCADRLMSKTPAKTLHSLLRVNFSASVPDHGGKRMTLNSIYSLTFALPKDSIVSRSVPESFVAGFIQNHPALRFLTCQSRKYPLSSSDTDDNNEDVEVWTLLSSSSFAKKHKGPQEFLPDETVETVSKLLLAALVESLVGAAEPSKSASAANEHTTLEVLDQRLQLWGAALPLNVWNAAANSKSSSSSKDGGAGFLYDAEHTVGACGDWLVDASIAGAWTSGRLLADHIMASFPSSSTTHALQGGMFVKSQATAKLGIASLPTVR